MPLGQ